ncbi:cytochrome c-type biogenesis protein [Modestobacter italicus]|uniref:cytochrome c-type biogenesis protein n=1 Tax=Modestobacter italicus (strain DSM 44449 / CECT 9708 / BC 501) TaxID=2732864 RepID=UPI00030A8DE2|nr:cytochrome c-type biogenesis protein [Modestobacter marinus]
MPDRVRRVGVLGAIIVLLGVAVAGLVFGTGRPTDRAYELEQRLRCPVCKSVSIAESMSDTAVAMRATVSEQIEAGRSDQEIVAYFTERYGDWILLDPPAGGDTLPLWLIPLGVAAVAVVLVLTRRRPADEQGQLSDADRERVAEAVAGMRATADEEDRL